MKTNSINTFPTAFNSLLSGESKRRQKSLIDWVEAFAALLLSEIDDGISTFLFSTRRDYWGV
jgi:uncharacterized protein YfdQ (DUF2303 family)